MNFFRITFLDNILIFITVLFCCKITDTYANKDEKATAVIAVQKRIPLLAGRINQGVITLRLNIASNSKPLILKGIKVFFTRGSNFEGISSLTINHSGESSINSGETIFGTAFKVTGCARIDGNSVMQPGSHELKLDIGIKPDIDLLSRFSIRSLELSFKSHSPVIIKPPEEFVYRPALVLRAHGQDNCDTYRIPGLITTGEGSLIAVYDVRYNSSKDLQEDIDIGMSRSKDGGQTWEPMKVIMDMGEWGGRSDQLNGTGDPSVLYDPVTKTIWVAALWMSGAGPDQALWRASKQGMTPEETGQFLLVKSTDDGLTWSEPINITNQIKDPEWQLLLQGPGRGIAMKDGSLVFPAQFKADIGTNALDGGQYTCHSTIVYSLDHGKTWNIGKGAKSNTTEAQVVELTDGSLMLNMRDDRNRSEKGDSNGRAVAVTTDLGKTWKVHSSTNSALPEPNCMASLIGTVLKIDGKPMHVLFFSNPNNKTSRSMMTIKASLDEGLTWPEDYQLELNSDKGYGYSCLTMVDENTIGILYEGIGDLFFQKIPVTHLLGSK